LNCGLEKSKDSEQSTFSFPEERAAFTITDAILIDITVLAADGTVLNVNQFALSRLGLSADDVKEGYLERTCHPDELNLVLDQRRTNLSKALPFKLEMRLLSKSGEFRWHLAQYNPLIDKSGHIIRWYVTAIDIDDRKRVEQILTQSETDLRTITDAIRQVIVVLAPDGTTLYANQVTCEQTGLTLDEVLGEGFEERVFHSDDVDGLRARKEGLSRARPFELELRTRQKSGEYRWKLIQYNPLKDDRGQIMPELRISLRCCLEIE
jgi:formate hydrogenlyase transcriptional activator